MMTDQEMRVFDWSVRQLMSMGYLGMREHILVLRALSHSLGRKKRFSSNEIKRFCSDRPKAGTCKKCGNKKIFRV